MRTRGSGMETVRIRDPGWRQFGSGIRDGNSSNPGWKKVGSRINIPDPQHCYNSCWRCWSQLVLMLSADMLPYLTDTCFAQ
jgi:hypothetical protein